MVDFSEAIKEHISSLSPDELAATEARRIVREAEQRRLMILEALFEPPAGSTDAPAQKELTVQIDPPSAPGTEAILRFSQGASYQDTHFLTPATYRLIAGGSDDATIPRPALVERFVVHTSIDGHAGVTVHREALMMIVATGRPIEIDRAKRLIVLEMQELKKSVQKPEQRLALFTERWKVETLRTTIDMVLEHVPARTMAMIIGKDLVSLSVRKEDMIVGPDGLLKSPLAAAIVKPEPRTMRPTVLISGNATAFRDNDAPYVKATYGTGVTRRLVIDVAKLHQSLSPLGSDETDAALDLLKRIVDRSASIEAEQHTAKAILAAAADRPGPSKPAMFAAKRAPAPIAPVPKAEVAPDPAAAAEHLDLQSEPEASAPGPDDAVGAEPVLEASEAEPDIISVATDPVEAELESV